MSEKDENKPIWPQLPEPYNMVPPIGMIVMPMGGTSAISYNNFKMQMADKHGKFIIPNEDPQRVITVDVGDEADNPYASVISILKEKISEVYEKGEDINVHLIRKYSQIKNRTRQESDDLMMAVNNLVQSQMDTMEEFKYVNDDEFGSRDMSKWNKGDAFDCEQHTVSKMLGMGHVFDLVKKDNPDFIPPEIYYLGAYKIEPEFGNRVMLHVGIATENFSFIEDEGYLRNLANYTLEDFRNGVDMPLAVVEGTARVRSSVPGDNTNTALRDEKLRHIQNLDFEAYNPDLKNLRIITFDMPEEHATFNEYETAHLTEQGVGHFSEFIEKYKDEAKLSDGYISSLLAQAEKYFKLETNKYSASEGKTITSQEEVAAINTNIMARLEADRERLGIPKGAMDYIAMLGSAILVDNEGTANDRLIYRHIERPVSAEIPGKLKPSAIIPQKVTTNSTASITTGGRG